MSTQEREKMVDSNYKKLAQVCCMKEIMKQEDLKTIFSNDDNINYQIPANKFFKLKRPDSIGNTALHMALQSYRIELFNALIEHGADFTIKNNNGESVVHQAVGHIFENTKRMSFRKIKDQYHYAFIEPALTAHAVLRICVNPVNKYGLSHFHAACITNHVKATKFFLKNGVSVNDAVSEELPYFPGYTPLHFAVTYYSAEVVETLLKNGANANLTDVKGLSPLHLIIKRNMDVVLRKRNHPVSSFIHRELESNERLINCILDNSGSEQWNLADSIGLSRLHVVSTLQSSSLVAKAVEEGADLQLTINADSPFLPGYTALHFAAQFNSDIVKLLVKNGGNLTAKDAKGVTPFDICMERWDGDFIHDIVMSQSGWSGVKFSDNQNRLIHFVECAKKEKTMKSFLRCNNIEINSFIAFDSPIWPGYTLLHLIVAFIGVTDFHEADGDEDIDFTIVGLGEEDLRHVKVIKDCVEMGVDFTIQDIHGSTPLHLAFRNCRPMAVNELLKYHSNGKIVNPVDKNGLTLLHIACVAQRDREDSVQELEEACQKLIRRLLGSGASPNSSLTSAVKWKNKLGKKVYLDVGWTPLHCAVATSNLSRIKILLEHGADVYAKDVNGLTPIHLILSSYCDYRDVGDVLLSSKNLKDSVADCGLNHLHVACYLTDASAVQKLLENGADRKAVTSCKKLLNCNHTYYHARTNYDGSFKSFSYCNACDPLLEPLSIVSPFAGFTPLRIAMIHSRYHIHNHAIDEMVKLLVQSDAKDYTENPNGIVPFYHSLDENVLWWKRFVVPELKSNEALRKCVQEHTGITMLHVNCATLDADAVVELLNSEVDINAKVHANLQLWPGCTPLHLALHDHEFREESELERFVTIADLLLKKGADVLCANARHSTPIHEAFRQFVRSPNHYKNQINAPPVARLLKSQKDFSVNPIDARGVSHFHIACFCGDVSAVEEFLKHGVDVNSRIDYFSKVDGGFTPLHFAVIGQSDEVVHLLLNHGADPNIGTCLDDTSLHLAVKFNLRNEDIFQSLMRAGADINAENLSEETPVDLLFNDYSHSEAAKIFLKYGVCVNVFDEKTNQGLIASLVSEFESRSEITEHPIFLAPIFNPSVNDDDSMGRSPIHNIVSTDKWNWISVKDYTEAIEKYVEAGFDVDRRDTKGRTALHLAVQFKNFTGITALLENGADFNIKDDDCNTAYACCFQFDQDNTRYELEVFKVLTRHINKLQSFGLHINHINRICDLTSGDQVPKKSYENEVSSLLNKKIDDSHSFTLLDFLSETNVVSAYPTLPRVIRDAIDNFFQNSSEYLRENFPDLACLLQLQYRKAKIRMTMIDPAKTSLNFVSAVEIPDLCSDIILKFLANDVLSNLIQAASADWQPNKRMRLE